MDATSRLAPAFSRFIHSYSLKLSVLAITLLTVPAVHYWQFQRYESQQSAALYSAVAQTSQLIAGMLRPYLANFQNESPEVLREALAGAAVGGVRLKLLLRPAIAGGRDFFYIMASPPVPLAYLKQEQRELASSGIFKNLSPACDHATDLSVHFTNPAGKRETITSLTPLHAGGNCWVVITSKSGSPPQVAPKSFLRTSVTIRAMTLVYILSTVLVLWLFLHLWRNVARFRQAARHIRLRRGGGVSFRHLNTIPELRGVAEDFDSLVSALVESQLFVRRAAEENAHALKAPLAVIAQSIEPLRRAMPAGDVPAQRSLQLLERSVLRLDALVSSVREMEEAAADVIYPEYGLIDLSGFLKRLLEAYSVTLVAQGKHLVTQIASDVQAYANEDLMESVMENLLENAASFTAKGGTIEVILQGDREFAKIRVADRGPGVDPRNFAHIFDRYISYRTPSLSHGDTLQAVDSHQGLGLWIVKRNVEGLGGTVVARNREGKGFEVTVSLCTKL